MKFLLISVSSGQVDNAAMNFLGYRFSDGKCLLEERFDRCVDIQEDHIGKNTNLVFHLGFVEFPVPPS